jgi:hypothetical protein
MTSDAGGNFTTGGYLEPDECMVSQNKAHKLCYQSDGNIVLYDQGDRQIWSAASAGGYGGGKPVGISLEADGRLVAFNASSPMAEWYWRSGNPTAVEAGPYDAILQDDGNLVIRRRRDDKTVWSTLPGKCC